MTPTRTKELQHFYWIKYDELWDEDRLKELWVKEAEIDEIIKIRGKELAYKDTVWFELWEWVLESARFKELQNFYGITLDDTQKEEYLKEKWVKEEDIAFIMGKKIKAKKKAEKRVLETNKKKMETKTKEQVESLRMHLKQLSNFSSWHLIRDELQQIVNEIELNLFKPDENKNTKKWTSHDINRAERKLLKLLINLPETLFDELKDFEEIEEKED